MPSEFVALPKLSPESSGVTIQYRGMGRANCRYV